MHCLLKKEKKKKRENSKRCRFEQHIIFFPWTRSEAGEEEDYFSSSVTATFSFKKTPPPLQKDADLPTTFHVLDGRWRGGSTVAAPATSPLFFTYKNRGEPKRKREDRREKRREDKAEKRRRNGKEKKERKKYSRSRTRQKKTEKGEEERETEQRRPPCLRR